MRIKIFRTEDEYAQLKKNAGRKKLPHFIHSEIMKRFGGATKGPCGYPDKQKLIRKEFNIAIPTEIEELIICEASRAGLNPSTFISRSIIDPALSHQP